MVSEMRSAISAGSTWETTKSASVIGNTLFDGISRTYADVPEGEALVLYGSEDTLEIAINGGNAARKLGLRRGDRVTANAGARKGNQ